MKGLTATLTYSQVVYANQTNLAVNKCVGTLDRVGLDLKTVTS